ncbi:hypothetical protein KAU55_04215 [Candidatus Bathyarchaeota archaeon]|nr:hypothetical protein [Candidatus Bathyarchaeota archaeon]
MSSVDIDCFGNALGYWQGTMLQTIANGKSICLATSVAAHITGLSLVTVNLFSSTLTLDYGVLC